MKIALLLLLILPLFAQDSRIAGRVIDADEAALPGAVVMINRADSGWKRFLLTNARGDYSLTQLSPGQYHVEAVKPGFKVAKPVSVTVRTGESVAVDLRMIVDRSAKPAALVEDVPSLFP